MKTQLFKLVLILTVSLVGTANPAIAQQTCNTSQTETAPAARFTVHGDGTATDQQTGLMWAQCLQGLSGSSCDSGTQTIHTWAQALGLTQATSDTQSSRADWRLPNIKELQTLVELACRGPAINTTVFPGLSTTFVWSASPLASITGSAWGVSFLSGNADASNRSFERAVRLVRGGQ